MTARDLVSAVVEGAERAGPGKVAVRSEGSELTYGELVAGAGALAATLAEAGVGTGDRVGVWMDKSPATVQVLLGVMASGAAYVPLDPLAPWRRCQAIARDCEFAAFVTDAGRAAHLGGVLEGQAPALVLVAGDEAGPPDGPALAPPVVPLGEAMARRARDLSTPRPEDLAYILYTSGSTGTPKGVVHTHRSGLAFTRWVQDRFDVGTEDVFSSHAPFHFDLSISDLYASLSAGASLQLVSRTEAMMAAYLVKSITTWGITVWYSVPSILVAMLDSGQLEALGLPSLRVLLFAGEVFPMAQLRRLRQAVPGARLVNLFGPTETNVCTYYEVPEDGPPPSATTLSIGRACEHMETFVLDEDGREVGPGVEGVLWVRGDNLMEGYWNDPDRTAAVLRPDPRGREGLAYATGDHVRLAADGNHDFLGRRDHLVKVRGYRVELGDIEATLSAHDAVLEAVAAAVPDGKGGNRIVASVVARSGATTDGDALRRHCADLLPSYMVPEQIEVRRQLPRTSTGKADRRALEAEWSARDTAGDPTPVEGRG